MASAETIEASPQARASASASADLPAAVGPTTTTGGGIGSAGSADRDAGAVPRPGRDLDQLTPEEVRRGTGDQHIGERAGGEGRVTGEVHQLVLPGAAGEDIGVLAARALDEHLLGAADAGLV